MEQIIQGFTTLEELDRFAAGNVIPEDFTPLALERLVDLKAIGLEVCLIIFILVVSLTRSVTFWLRVTGNL